MSQVLIHQYLAQLDVLKKVGGTHRESVVREAFKDLLKGWGRQHDLVFIPEYKLDSATKDTRFVDGALLHELRVPFGYWEAKDAKDDLDEEIAFKFKRGYPQDNIVFEDSTQAVRIQHRQEVMRCDVTDVKQLEKLLKLFFAFERAEIADFRKAVAQFKTDLPAVLEALRGMIEHQHATNVAFAAASVRFLTHAQEAINPALTAADVREMLIQHILTEEIFSKVFDDSDFHRKNNVANELYRLEETFFTGALKKSTLKGLEAYYAAIRAAAAQIGSHYEKQTFLKVIYENFYKVYNAKAADRLGVVYTPNEIVRFMIEGADWLCETHFGRNLVDRDVQILDPATGTGTFICELLEHFRGQPKKLQHKYREELHANEVAILPYYVANLNIEATYAAITGEYEEFTNLCFVDTLDNVGLHTAAHGTTADLFGSVSEENVARIKRQNSRKISVIIGNPPNNANQANQANENDNNKNREYPAIDARIKQTYIAQSTAQKTKLYDMYARFFRWASDRLHADGVLAFVTNRSFVDSRTFDGFRKTVAKEFAEVWVVDLKGDARTSGERRRQEGGNVFDDQIRVGVAISFFVRKAGTSGCRIRYASVRDYAKSDEKREFLAAKRFREHAFEEARPDVKGNWIGLTTNEFETYLPVVHDSDKAVFARFASAVKTNRDEWVYHFDRGALLNRVQFLIERFNAQRKVGLHDHRNLDYSIKWSSSLKQRTHEILVDESLQIRSVWRPFVCQWYYSDKPLSDRLTRNHFEFFGPDLTRRTPTIYLPGPPSTRPPHALAVAGVADYHVTGDAIALPASLAANALDSHDNITDWALTQFRQHYQLGRGKKAEAITKQAIFHYVYAVLHDPLCREKYAQNLKREFPRIPLYGDSLASFEQWAAWGAELMQLHIGYEAVEPWPLQRTDTPDTKARAAGQSPKCMLKSLPDEGRIVVDSETVLAGIPPEAWIYKLGNRSALDWVLDQHKEKKPKDPTIREKFDTYRFKDHKERVIDLLARVARVSVETVQIVEAMREGSR
ncbi:MAG: type ISP restriction/modification enzyme [Rubrivivax sp.]|nr:type ISP restriction/modification enzyme [Rubrivivax sp.]